jgi:hypothetical protein
MRPPTFTEYFDPFAAFRHMTDAQLDNQLHAASEAGDDEACDFLVEELTQRRFYRQEMQAAYDDANPSLPDPWWNGR